jgi:hypothetical protein
MPWVRQRGGIQPDTDQPLRNLDVLCDRITPTEARSPDKRTVVVKEE